MSTATRSPAWAVADDARTMPLRYIEQRTVGELAAEVGTACRAGMLMLQAVGLGGLDVLRIDRHVLLGVAAPDAPGLGFRFDTDPSWPLPNPTRRDDAFTASCPPHVPDTGTAAQRLVARAPAPGSGSTAWTSTHRPSPERATTWLARTSPAA